MESKLVLRVHDFEKVFGTEVLFDKTSLIVHEGDKIALLGQNGCGKTTFVRCLLSDEDYGGEIELNLDFSFAVMEQEKVFDESDLTFEEYLKSKRERLIKRREEIEEKFSEPSVYEDSVLYEKILNEHSKLSLRIDTNVDESILKDMLEELGFEMQDYSKKISSLSGGQRTKLRLCEVLCRDADFFVLDEPTNHLDFESIRWLEKRLFYLKKTFIVISHDRYFVNLVSSRIVEIENKKFESYDMSYVSYIKKRDERWAALRHKHYAVDKEKKRLAKSEKEKREWAHLHGSKKLRIQADKLARKSKELGVPPNPDDFEDNYELKFLPGNYSGNMVFKGRDVSKLFGDFSILNNVSFDISSGEKIAILGKNGCGKSTLLKLLCSLESVSAGEFKVADDIKIGYLSQEFFDMDRDMSVMDYLWQADQRLMEHHIIANLIKFGFSLNRINDKIKTLSGGEKTRVSLVRLMLSKCDVLLLDEPTNHLDVQLIESLENALKSFKGTIVFVSHDRYFMNKVAKKLFVIEKGSLTILEGNYRDNFS